MATLTLLQLIVFQRCTPDSTSTNLACAKVRAVSPPFCYHAATDAVANKEILPSRNQLG